MAPSEEVVEKAGQASLAGVLGRHREASEVRPGDDQGRVEPRT